MAQFVHIWDDIIIILGFPMSIRDLNYIWIDIFDDISSDSKKKLSIKPEDSFYLYERIIMVQQRSVEQLDILI